jgi:hypothetical protein
MYRVLLGKPKGERPLGRPGYGWEYNMKLDLEEIDKEGVDWFLPPQDGGSVAGCCEHGNECMVV